ncbi:MAG TPA: hypothetical protein VFU05_16065 [Cyclobacteriaceae bacterium]|nr:hypothetical protein [Cyclobacteriaceae bacterium]
MNIKLILTVTVGFAICSCNPGRDSGTNDKITGSYTREYSVKVVHPETGNVVGMRTIRDTIFIRPTKNGYDVSNNRWMLNDYDRESWQSMEHSEDHPLRTYQATFDPTDNSLNAEFMMPLYLDQNKQKLYKDKEGNSAYERVQ